MAKQTIGLCELCGRQEVVLTEHHLTPREEGGAFLPTAFLCIPCHKQVHALYTNTGACRTFEYAGCPKTR